MRQTYERGLNFSFIVEFLDYFQALNLNSLSQNFAQIFYKTACNKLNALLQVVKFEEFTGCRF
ncbi:hypothetical protein H740_00367 [Campylobacter showae CC57C]|uniref:Uncharacterized protein n=1 Tax=Campylobacter showae CC57C TaxID=1073353 RepID=M3I4S5_9BACT|nr:hypothetical protein H740_00367 [Campylobacter showae CC57C]